MPEPETVKSVGADRAEAERKRFRILLITRLGVDKVKPKGWFKFF